MKKNIWLSVVALAFLMSCTIESREIFDLSYQEKQVVYTLERGPFKSINPDGIFNAGQHNVWDFDIESMEVTVYDVLEADILNRVVYSIEVVEDRNATEGILRLYGNGAFNNQFVGVVALTNSHGAFLKLSIKEASEGIVEQTRQQSFWAYASDPIIFRIHRNYLNQEIVSLDENEFLPEREYLKYIPIIRTLDNGVEQYVLEQTTVTIADDGTETESAVSDIILNTTTVIPLNVEVYSAVINGVDRFLGLEFHPNPNNSKMKMLTSSSFEGAKQELANQTTYNRELKQFARKSNRAIQRLQQHQMVLLKKPPVSGEYFWDETDELIFNADDMTLRLITTLSILPPFGPFGATNIFDYDITMVIVEGDRSGIFKIDGSSGIKLANRYAAFNIIEEDGKLFLDMSPQETEAEAKEELEIIKARPARSYQDQRTAVKPFRLGKNLRDVGEVWVRLNQSLDGGMSFDGKNTEVFQFLDIVQNQLKYSLIANGVTETSFYKLEVVVDINDTNGVFLMHGYTDESFETLNTAAPLNGKYWAVERGSEIYKTQAKFGIGNSIEDSIRLRNSRELFNLHERRALPNDYRVIIHMEDYGDWVAMSYVDAEGVAFEEGRVPTPLPTLGTQPVYFKNDTYEMLFNTSSGVPEVVVTPYTGVDSGSAVPGTPTKYSIETDEEFSPTYGVFKFTREGDVVGTPDLHEKFMAIRVDLGATADRAYITVGDTATDAVQEMNRIYTENRKFYTHHAKETAPLTATFAQHIGGIRYIRGETDVAGTPNGQYTPYDTEYITFSFSPLFMAVETVTPSSTTPSKSSYGITMRDDGGRFRGIFQLDLPGSPLHNQYGRVDIQEGANERESVRILINADLARLQDDAVPPIGNGNAFTVAETTHKDETKINLPQTALDSMVGISREWASVDAVDKLYDFRNNQQFTFDLDADQINIRTILDGQEIRNEMYSYLVMENKQDGDNYEAVLLLSGPETFNGQYLALIGTTHSFPENANREDVQGTRFAIGRSFNTAKSGLRDGDAYIQPTNPLANNEVKLAFDNYGLNTATPPGFGTPSFVWMRNGSYDPRNTEIWVFDTTRTNVTITHNGGSQVIYNLYMVEADAVTGTAPNIVRNTALFYLKSATAGALYNNTYVQVRNHVMVNTAGAEDSESTMNLVINEDRAVAVNPDTEINLTMRDLRSANISSPAIDLAAANSWVRLDNREYQLNIASTETWEFKVNNTAQIRVTAQDGTVHNYNYSPREDTSTHRGVFALRSVGTVGPYNDHVVAIGIGNEPAPVGGATGPAYDRGDSSDARSMRLATVSLNDHGGNLGAAQAAAKAAMEALPEWNYRVATDALLHFNPIMEANRIDNTGGGWVKLTRNANNQYEYVEATTERWIFLPSANNLQNRAANGGVPASDVQDVLIGHTGNTEPTERHGIKLLTSSSGGVRAEYKIFRTRDTGANARSNTYVVLEMGRGLNEKLMRVGMGDTLEEALAEFNALDADFNWSTYDRAVASWGPVGIIDGTGREWTLQRTGVDDNTETASAVTTSGGGHFRTGADGSNKPSYNPADTIDIKFSTTDQTMTINYIKGIQSTIRSYGLIRVEQISSTEGIYIVQGFGLFDKNFVYIEVSEEPVNGSANAGKRGRMSIAKTLSEVKGMNQELKTAGTWNFFESDWIRVSDAVFTEANRRHAPTTTVTDGQGSYVELGFEETYRPNVYDPLLMRSYTFIPTARTIEGVSYEDRTVIISNISPSKTRDDRYTYEIQDIKNPAGEDLRSYAILRGTGPDGGKSIGIRLPLNENASEAVVVVGENASMRGALQWDTALVEPAITGAANDFYRYRTLKSVESKSGILNRLGTLTGMVTLDSDLIYVDNNTTEWTFSLADRQATVAQRTTTTTTTTTYKTILVASEEEDNGAAGLTEFKGILFLKDSAGTGEFHRNYVGIHIQEIGGAQSIKFYPFSSTADGETPVTAFTKAEEVLTSTGLSANFVEKSTVFFPPVEPIIDALIRRGEWVGLSDTFEIVPAATATHLQFLAGREVNIKVGNSVVTGRFKPVWDEDSQTRTVVQIVQKGDVPLLEGFNNAYFAIDLINRDNSDGMKGLLRQNINIHDEGERNALIAARNALADPTYIPKTIVDLSRRALETLFNVSSGVWRQVKADNTLAGAQWNEGIRGWEALYAADPETAPWNYAPGRKDNQETGLPDRFSISRGSSAPAGDNVSVEADREQFPYFIKMVSDDGINDNVFRLYGRDPGIDVYQSEISNQFHAIRVGTGPNHFRGKFARGATEADARSKLNTMPFYNMVAREVWVDTSTTWISNMNINAFNGDGETVQNNGWGEWVDRSTGGFDLNNHDLWNFIHTPGNESVTYNQVRDGMVTSFSYGLTLMQVFEEGGYYVLTGHGPHNGRILAYRRGDPKAATAAERNGANFFITTADNNTYEAAVLGLNMQIARNQYNWVERRTLRESIGVLETVVDNGLSDVVSLDASAYGLTPSVQVFNKRDHRQLIFSVDAVNVTASLTVIETVNGVGTTINYDAVPQKITGISEADEAIKGVIVLGNPNGALNGEIFAVQVDVANDKVFFKNFEDIASATTALIAGLTDAADSLYLLRSEITDNYNPLINLLDNLGPTVDLDQDRIYLDHETKEYAFDPVAGTVLISTRTDQNGTTIQQNNTYFLNEVKGVTPFGTAGSTAPTTPPTDDAAGERRGLFFLKGTRGAADPLNNQFWGVAIDADNDDTEKGNKVIISADRTDIDDTKLDENEGLTAVKEAVHLDDTYLREVEIIADIGEGLGSTQTGTGDFTYKPEDTETVFFDAKQRLYFVASSISGATGTNYLRIKHYPMDFVEDSRAGKRIGLIFVSNSRSDLRFKGRYPVYPSETAQTSVETPVGTANLGGTTRKGWSYALGIVDGSVNVSGIFVGYGWTGDVVAQALENLNGADDPIWVPRKILENNPQVLTTLQSGSSTWYIPVDEDRTAVTDVSAANFAFTIITRTAGTATAVPVYDLRLSQRSATTPTDVTGSAFNYLTKIINDGGPNDGTIQAHGKTSTTWDPIVTNKYIALRNGINENETRARLAIGDTATEALQKLNDLTFFNYATREVLTAQSRVLTNMARLANNTRLTWVQTEGDTYDAFDTTDWIFDEKDQLLTVYTIVEGSTNTLTYQLNTIEDESTHKGVYQSIGFGPLGQQFIAFDNETGVDAEQHRANVGLAKTITGAKTARDGTAPTGARKFSIVRKDTILNFGSVMNTILANYTDGTRTLMQYFVSGDVLALDLRNNFQYKFATDTRGDNIVDITTLRNGVSRSDRYNLSLIEQSANNTQGYYRLIGTGPDAGQILTIANPNADRRRIAIMISGHEFSEFNQAGTGVIANSVAGFGTATPLYNVGVMDIDENIMTGPSIVNNIQVRLDHSMLQRLQNFGQISSLSGQRIYNPTTTTSWGYNRNSYTLTLTSTVSGVPHLEEYNILLSGLTATNPNTDTRVTYYLKGINSEGANNTDYHNKYLVVEPLDTTDNYRFIKTLGTGFSAVQTAHTAQKAKSTTLPYEYWTHELASTANVSMRGFENLEAAMATKTSLNTSDGTLQGTLTSVPFEGLAFLADPRIYKATATSATRVRTTTTYPDGGYYDGRDSYVMTDSPVGMYSQVAITQYLTNAAGTTTNRTTRRMYVRVLRSLSSTRFVIQFINDLDEDGDIAETIPAEMAAMFLHKVMAVDLGSQGANSDNIQLGYATPAGSTKAQMDAAVTAAIADLDARTGNKKHIPNLVPLSMAQESHRVVRSMSGLKKTFVNGLGFELATDDGDFFFEDNRLFVVPHREGTTFATLPAGYSTMTLSLKPKADINSSDFSKEQNNTQPTLDVTIRPIKHAGSHTVVFKIMRPSSSTHKLVTDAYWSNLIFNKYHAITAGRDDGIGQDKWGIGDTVDEAMSASLSLANYNTGIIEVATTHRIDVFTNAYSKGPSGTVAPNVVWVQTNITSVAPGGRVAFQQLPAGVTIRNWRFYRNGTGQNVRYSVLIADYANNTAGDNTQVGRAVEYALNMKHVFGGIGNATSGMATVFSLSGFGPLDGAIVADTRLSHLNNRIIIVPKGSYDVDFIGHIMGFMTGDGVGKFDYDGYRNNLKTVRDTDPNTIEKIRY